MEIWKDIKDYEGLYQVSNYGRVKNVKTQRLLKQWISKTGYLQVGLSKIKKKTFNVHSLVAKAFLEEVEGKGYINHLDRRQT